MYTFTDFEQRQPLATRYFREALANNQLANAMVLVGQPLDEMGQFVLRLAQSINCLQPLSDKGLDNACGTCRNCKWIESNRHPDVITLTNTSYLMEWDSQSHDFKPKASKTNLTITVGQLDAMMVQVGKQSPGFIQVVILAEGKLLNHDESQAQRFIAPSDAPETDELAFSLSPLNKRCFTDRVANKFLKTLEEPPGNVLFFLLTDDESKLMDTIVSRCQRIPFKTPTEHFQPNYPQQIQPLLEALVNPPANPNTLWLDHARYVLEQLHEESMSTADCLELAQQFAWEQARQVVDDPHALKQLSKRLRQLEEAAAMSRGKVREDAIIENLVLTSL